MNTENLLQNLIESTRQLMNQFERIKTIDPTVLRWKENKDSWSVLECLEHLNLYGDHYLPQMEKAISTSKHPYEAEFKSGFIGDYFAKSMLPKGKLNKMKTFKVMNPLNSELDLSVLNRFAEQELHLLNLLSKSRDVSWNKAKVVTSISKWIRMNLGDTFRFYINHQIRHFKQIERILIKQGLNTSVFQE
jgi:hypothetical protein